MSSSAFAYRRRPPRTAVLSLGLAALALAVAADPAKADPRVFFFGEHAGHGVHAPQGWRGERAPPRAAYEPPRRDDPRSHDPRRYDPRYYDPRRDARHSYDPRSYDPRQAAPGAYDPPARERPGHAAPGYAPPALSAPARPRSWAERAAAREGDPRQWEHVSSRQEVAFSPRYETGVIVVSFTDKKLYFVTAPGRALSYTIGVPVPEERWSGDLLVSDKQEYPRWFPTPDMRRKDPTLPEFVPGGHPRNPLGPRALYLGDTLYRIHGTDAPWSVGHVVSNGCIRLYNRDIHDLYERVPIGARVVVTYDSFLRVAEAPAAPAATRQPAATRGGWGTTRRDPWRLGATAEPAAPERAAPEPRAFEAEPRAPEAAGGVEILPWHATTTVTRARGW